MLIKKGLEDTGLGEASSNAVVKVKGFFRDGKLVKSHNRRNIKKSKKKSKK